MEHTISKKRSIKKYLYGLLALVPILIIRLDSLLYHISVLGGTELLKDNSEEENGNKSTVIPSLQTKELTWLISGIAINYLCTYLIFFKIIELDMGIRFDRFILLPFYLMLPPLIIAIIWRIKYLKEKSSSKMVKNTLIILVPTIVSVVIFSLVKPSHLSSRMDYVNSAWTAIILASFFEEMFYRGFIYKLLKRMVSIRWAEMISSFIFLTSHFNLMYLVVTRGNSEVLYNVVLVFILGVVTCRMYDTTKSIVTPILYHAINNGALYYIISMYIV